MEEEQLEKLMTTTMIPEGWEYRAKTGKDILKLGTMMVSMLQVHWQKISKQHATEIRFANLLTEDLPNARRKRPRSRIQGNQFTQCGTCPYAARKNGLLHCSVTLAVHLTMRDTEVETEAPCMFRERDKSFTTFVTKGLEWRRREAMVGYAEAAINEVLLEDFVKYTKRKPPFANLRPNGWFKPGDRIMFENNSGGYSEGEVIAIDEASEEVEVRKFGDGRTIEADRTYKGLMHKWEFEYMQRDWEFTLLWFTNMPDNEMTDPRKLLDWFMRGHVHVVGPS